MWSGGVSTVGGMFGSIDAHDAQMFAVSEGPMFFQAVASLLCNHIPSASLSGLRSREDYSEFGAWDFGDMRDEFRTDDVALSADLAWRPAGNAVGNRKRTVTGFSESGLDGTTESSSREPSGRTGV